MAGAGADSESGSISWRVSGAYVSRIVSAGLLKVR